MIDSQGNIATANQQWRTFVCENKRLYKHSVLYTDGGIGRPFNELYGSLMDEDLDGRKEVLDRVDLVQREGGELRAKEYLLGKSDSRRWIEISALPIVNGGERHTL